MLPNRRDFLGRHLPVLPAAGLVVRHIGAAQLPKTRSYLDLDSLIRSRGRIGDLRVDELPTPAVILDLDAFEHNLDRMARHASFSGKKLRPHAKTHKCVQIARRQVAAGATGVCVATVPEAEVMAGGGIRGVLLTSPIAQPYKAEKMVALAKEDSNLMVTVDHSEQIQLYQEKARQADLILNVLVDVNVGDGRTGTEPGDQVLELARLVHTQENLRLRGLQAYSGRASHLNGYSARREYSLQVMGRAAESLHRMKEAGLPAEIFSGGSTGTYNIDTELPDVTELQVGSYVFMDIDYRRIGGRGGDVYDDFRQALTVTSTVVSVNQPNRVTIDAGVKSFSTDRSFGPEAKGQPELAFSFAGDEFGILKFNDGPPSLKLGDRIEFVIPHCDPTVNLYDRIFACRRGVVEAVWSIMNRFT